MDKLELGRPVILGNMLLVPVLGDGDKVEVITVDEGLSRGLRIEETGVVEKVFVDNVLDEDLFIMDGEELIGERQDRIVAYSTVVEKKSRSSIEVLCVEKGRWEGDIPFSSGFSAFPRLRSLISSGNVKREELQKSVWRLIESKLTSLRVISKTQSLHHTFTDRKEDLELYTRWEPEKNTVGIMAFSNRGFLCCDLFASEDIFRKLKDKVLKGYALDALEDRIKGRSFSIDLNKVSKIWENIKHSRTTDIIPRSNGVEERLRSDRIIGKRFIYKETLLHSTFFPSR